MAFGDINLERGSKGDDVVELQLRLAGFRGTTWDGSFGPGTELLVLAFQKDYMKVRNPSGVVDNETFAALHEFAQQFPVDFSKVTCPCGQCNGFGEGRYANQFREGKPEIEAYHRREYPGIHKAILHTFRAACFYLKSHDFPMPFLTSGYRCWHHNKLKNRLSTNHMGKALDIDFPMDGIDKREDAERCDAARSLLVDKAQFQIGWSGSNKKSLEPSRIAPTWIHMDVRSYSRKYLADKFFVTNLDSLDTF